MYEEKNVNRIEADAEAGPGAGAPEETEGKA